MVLSEDITDNIVRIIGYLNVVILCFQHSRLIKGGVEHLRCLHLPKILAVNGFGGVVQNGCAFNGGKGRTSYHFNGKREQLSTAAKGRAVMEFGSRRAQGSTGAVNGARASYIAGCIGTACTIADQKFSIPAIGTMAHSWVQMFDSELDAFNAYAEKYEVKIEDPTSDEKEIKRTEPYKMTVVYNISESNLIELFKGIKSNPPQK